MCPSRLLAVNDFLKPYQLLEYASYQQNTTNNTPNEIGKKDNFFVFTSKLMKIRYVPVEKVATYC